MMTIKHTPGPWEVDSGSYLGCTNEHYHSITAGCGYHVDSHDDGFELSGCMSTANALLIAAAPDLLEALEMCISSMESLLSDFNPFDQAAYDKALAAIAKAKG